MTRSLLFALLLATGVALADDAPKAKRAKGAAEAQEKAKEEVQEKPKEGAQEKAKEVAQPSNEDPNAKVDPDLGMSILGNQDAPKALVIVPWKRSEMGNALGISTMLDDSRLPIDKEVFVRMLSYYEIRSGTARHDGAPVGRGTAPADRDAAQPASAAHRRKQ